MKRGIVTYIKKPLWELSKLEHATNIALAFQRTQQVTWSSTWPIGHCFVSSLFLAPLIRLPLEWEVAVVVGMASDCKPHAWIESPEGDIIDPTYGQFDPKAPLRVLPAGHSGELGHMGEIRLSVPQEDFCRNALRPSNKSGWSQDADIQQLFGSHPAFTTTLKQ